MLAKGPSHERSLPWGTPESGLTSLGCAKRAMGEHVRAALI